MSSSLPEGHRIRPATDADAPALADLLRASETAVRGASAIGPEDIRSWSLLTSLESNSWVVEDAGGPVAGGLLIPHGSAAEFAASVHPRALGRGLGSALLDLAEARAAELGLERLQAGAFVENEDAVALLTARGHRDVRHYFAMRIDFDAPPAKPEWPEEIAGDTFRPEDARAFYDALNEAFAEEWGWAPMAYEEWRRVRIEADDFDPGLWFVARDGEELAAVARCEPNRFGGGFVGAIGVRPAWRRRGLGLALLRQAFVEFHSRGTNTVRLGVDAENPTGATRLYERAGMRIESEDVVYAKELG